MVKGLGDILGFIMDRWCMVGPVHAGSVINDAYK